jgi:hypothetical protein
MVNINEKEEDLKKEEELKEVLEMEEDLYDINDLKEDINNFLFSKVRSDMTIKEFELLSIKIFRLIADKIKDKE